MESHDHPVLKGNGIYKKKTVSPDSVYHVTVEIVLCSRKFCANSFFSRTFSVWNYLSGFRVTVNLIVLTFKWNISCYLELSWIRFVLSFILNSIILLISINPYVLVALLPCLGRNYFFKNVTDTQSPQNTEY